MRMLWGNEHELNDNYIIRKMWISIININTLTTERTTFLGTNSLAIICLFEPIYDGDDKIIIELN